MFFLSKLLSQVEPEDELFLPPNPQLAMRKLFENYKSYPFKSLDGKQEQLIFTRNKDGEKVLSRSTPQDQADEVATIIYRPEEAVITLHGWTRPKVDEGEPKQEYRFFAHGYFFDRDSSLWKKIDHVPVPDDTDPSYKIPREEKTLFYPVSIEHDILFWIDKIIKKEIQPKGILAVTDIKTCEQVRLLSWYWKTMYLNHESEAEMLYKQNHALPMRILYSFIGRPEEDRVLSGLI